MCKRALVIVPGLPVPPLTGDRLRTRKLLDALAEEFRVTLVGFGEPEDATVLAGSVHDVVAVPWTPSAVYADMQSEDPEVARRAFETLAHPEADPWIVAWYESAELREVIKLAASVPPALTMCSTTTMARYLDVAPVAPTVLDLHNVHAAVAERDASKPEDQDEVVRIRKFERAAISRSDVALVVSEVEAAHARALAPGANVRVVSNGVDTTRFARVNGAGRPEALLFTGTMNYAPNVQAVEWFVRDVLPRIPKCTLDIVGANPHERVSCLASLRVRVEGEVPDMRPYYADARVVVVPVLSGGGTRTKILEAAACGKAIVSTSIGAEGLDLCDGREIVIADDPEAFAAAITRLIREPGLCSELGQNARRAVARYDWSRVQARFLDAVRSLVVSR
jgi:glycosyltransferase involved in cell wall biosynthesis